VLNDRAEDLLEADPRPFQETSMYARLVETQVAPDGMDECIAIVRERNAPSIASQPGLDHGHWLVDRATGKAISVIFWTDAIDERASRADIPQPIEGMAHVPASRDVRQETFEAVHEQR
jgi:hypothetical protein